MNRWGRKDEVGEKISEYRLKSHLAKDRDISSKSVPQWDQSLLDAYFVQEKADIFQKTASDAKDLKTVKSF